MSRSRNLQLHIGQMEEIRTILNSMKNLAYIETHKLARFQIMQGQAVANIEQTAMDFLDHYPLPAVDDNTRDISILMGAERGFCGDFNESLINTVAAEAYSGIIAIGSRLCDRLVDYPLEIIASIEGANVAEEVPVVLNRLIDAISSLPVYGGDINRATHVAPALQLTAVYHDNETGQIIRRQILPPFPRQQQRRLRYGNPPVLNLEPSYFFSDLIDHYLFAVLHEIFYMSLMAENQRRLQHLEGAVKHLDDETVNLRRKSQIYRQEEITEEIEVILLNSEIS